MSRFSSIPRGYVWIAALVIAIVLGAVWVWMQYVQTYHLATVNKGVLYRDGFRTMREFQTAVADVRPRMIVSLLDADETARPPFAMEQGFCTRSRVRYLNIPVTLGGWPSGADIRRFLEIAQRDKFQPVLVHCAQGVRRTGMMVAAYQMSVLGWDKEKTKSAILTFGHSERSIGDVRKFIDVYDPVARDVTEKLAQSVE